ncbi:hypothetical protein WG66_009626 [Moniliophthora roreri]|nr:hypothetical protein WG66_009626 [Moniliophthora roreri]
MLNLRRWAQERDRGNASFEIVTPWSQPAEPTLLGFLASGSSDCRDPVIRSALSDPVVDRRKRVLNLSP